MRPLARIPGEWSDGVLEWWSDGVVEYWNDGVMEWWSDGVLEYRKRRFGLPFTGVGHQLYHVRIQGSRFGIHQRL